MEEFVGVNFKIGGEDSLVAAMNNVSRAVVQLVTNLEKLHGRLGDAAVRQAKRGEAAHLSAEQAKQRATEQAIREDNRLSVRLARDQIRTLSDTVKEHERAERDKTAATKREAAERTRAEAKAQKEAAREATKAQKETSAAQLKSLNERQSVKRTAALGAYGGFRDGASTLAQGAGVITGAIGTAGILSGVEGEMQLRSRLSALAVSTREPGKAGIDVDATRKQIQKIAGETGIKATDIAEALNLASEHGTGLAGVQAFQANLPMFSKLALATDTRIQDVADNSATLTSLGVTDPEEQSRVIRALATAAKAGNIAMKELGGLVAVGAGAGIAGQYEGTASDRVLQSSALMQLARTSGNTSAEDAATGVKNFYADVEKKRADLEFLGVKTFTKDAKGNKVRRDAVAQYVDAIAASKGDPTKLEGILGSQSRGVGTALLRAYKEGYEVDGGKRVFGGEAVRAQVGNLMSNAMSESDVAADANTRLADTATKVSAEMEKFKATVGEKLLPVLDQNIGKFADLAVGVTKLVGFIADSPVKAAAEFLAIKTILGGLGSWVSSWIGSKVFAPITNVSAGVVNVAGGIPGIGKAPGVSPSLPGGGGKPGVGGWLGGMFAANPIGAGVAVGLAAGYGLLEVDDYLMQNNPGYKKWMDENGVAHNDSSSIGMRGIHEKNPLVGRDKARRVMNLNEGTRAGAVTALGFGDAGPGKAGDALSVPGLGISGGPNGQLAPLELAPDTKIEIGRASTDALGESIVSGIKRANDNKAGTSIAERNGLR